MFSKNNKDCRQTVAKYLVLPHNKYIRKCESVFAQTDSVILQEKSRLPYGKHGLCASANKIENFSARKRCFRKSAVQQSGVILSKEDCI